VRSRGETAIQQSWEEIIQFFQARGCAGTEEEIKRVVLNRIQGAKILRQAAQVLPTSFRPQMHNLSAPPSGLATAVSGLRRGRERREVKLRQKWRRVEDKSRPSGLTGAAHRRGGSLKRARVDAAAIGTHVAFSFDDVAFSFDAVRKLGAAHRTQWRWNCAGAAQGDSAQGEGAAKGGPRKACQQEAAREGRGGGDADWGERGCAQPRGSAGGGRRGAGEGGSERGGCGERSKRLGEAGCRQRERAVHFLV